MMHFRYDRAIKIALPGKARAEAGRVVTLIGPRQSGKTTLAREIVSATSNNYFDLEDPTCIARLEQPLTALSGLRGTVVIDEVQRRSDLFPVLSVLADCKPLPAFVCQKKTRATSRRDLTLAENRYREVLAARRSS